MIKKIKTTIYDSADYLDSREAISVYMEEVMAMNDPALLAKALDVIARAKAGC